MPHYERKERGELMATDQTREAIELVPLAVEGGGYGGWVIS